MKIFLLNYLKSAILILLFTYFTEYYIANLGFNFLSWNREYKVFVIAIFIFYSGTFSLFYYTNSYGRYERRIDMIRLINVCEDRIQHNVQTNNFENISYWLDRLKTHHRTIKKNDVFYKFDRNLLRYIICEIESGIRANDISHIQRSAVKLKDVYKNIKF